MSWEALNQPPPQQQQIVDLIMSWEPVLKKISKLQDGSQSGLVK
jgi:hypothetical protein